MDFSFFNFFYKNCFFRWRSKNIKNISLQKVKWKDVRNLLLFSKISLNYIIVVDKMWFDQTIDQFMMWIMDVIFLIVMFTFHNCNIVFLNIKIPPPFIYFVRYILKWLVFVDRQRHIENVRIFFKQLNERSIWKELEEISDVNQCSHNCYEW